MANRITGECIQCGACESECPNQAISLNEDNLYVIDEAKCDECAAGGEAHCKAVCPLDGAIAAAA